ncbi:hypothetical protein Tco_1254745 [Tanacetum coccineum]
MGYVLQGNVGYPELIWEDFAFQINNRQLKKGRREIMPYHRFTKIIINHFLSKHQSLAKLQHLHTHTFKDDGVVNRLKFVKISEDFQEYGLPIPETMLTEDIKQSESYQMFIKYSTGLIPLKKSRADKSLKLKGVLQPLANELLAADTMQAIKESKKINRRQPNTGGLSKGTGSIQGVPDESTVVFSPSSEGTGTKPGVPDKEKVTSEAKADVYSDEDKEKKDDDDDKSIDIEETGDEETDDEFVLDDADAEKTKEVNDDNKKAKLPPSSSSLSVSLGFGNQFFNLSSDKSTVGTLKDSADDEINSLLDIQIQQKILQIQSPSILTVPVSVISEPAVLSPIPEIPTVSSAITPLPPHSVSTISPILQKTKTPIPTPPITTEAPPITTVAPVVTTILDPLPVISQRVSVLEKDVQELKAVDHTTALLASLRSEIPSAVNAYLGSSLGDVLQKVLQKHTEELIQQYPQQVNYKDVIKESVQENVINEVKNLLPKFLPKTIFDFATPVIQSTVKKALEKTQTALTQSSSQAQSSLKAAESLSEYELKNILFERMDKSHSYLTHDKHQALYDALFNSLCLDDVIARGQADPEKILRKRDRDDEDPLAGPNQGKKTKRSRTKESKPSKKSSTTKESSKGKSPAKTSKSGKSVTAEELAFEMASDDIKQTVDDVVNDADQPPDDTTQTKDNAPKYDWFKQPPQLPTLDPEWNTR